LERERLPLVLVKDESELATPTRLRHPDKSSGNTKWRTVNMAKLKTKVEATATPSSARLKTRLEILKAQHEKVKQNPAYGIEVAKRAGILDENGELTAYFKSE